MTNKSQLSILPGIVFVAVVAIIIGTSVFVLNVVNMRRNADVVATYTDETNDFIARNENGVSRIFTTLFPESVACSSKNTNKEVQVCLEAVSGQIHGAIDHNITDYSSLLFITYDKTLDKVLVLRLSGETIFHDTNSINSKKLKDIVALLKGTSSAIPWDDYFYELRGNEVVVPVMENGQVIGAIVRGVIE